MTRYKMIYDYALGCLMGCFALGLFVMAKHNEVLTHELKEAQESLALIETKLDHESFERVQCQAILGYVTQESMRLTELVVKKGKK